MFSSRTKQERQGRQSNQPRKRFTVNYESFIVARAEELSLVLLFCFYRRFSRGDAMGERALKAMKLKRLAGVKIKKTLYVT